MPFEKRCTPAVAAVVLALQMPDHYGSLERVYAVKGRWLGHYWRFSKKRRWVDNRVIQRVLDTGLVSVSEPDGDGVRVMVLTDEGRKIRLRSDGRIVPEGWKPKIYWPHAKAFVCTGPLLCKVFLSHESCHAWWEKGKCDPAPWMQIASPRIVGTKSKAKIAAAIESYISDLKGRYPNHTLEVIP